MTAKWHEDHVFQRCGRDRFVETYFSEDFNNKVSSVIGLKVRELVEHEVKDDGKEVRRVRMVPEVNLPRAVKKLLGNAEIKYAEVSTYDPENYAVDFFIDHGARDRVEVKGVIRFIDEGDNTRRTIDGEVTCKIFALGKVVERLIESETVKAYGKINRFMQRYLDASSDTEG